jgi:hypothetical protein
MAITPDAEIETGWIDEGFDLEAGSAAVSRAGAA